MAIACGKCCVCKKPTSKRTSERCKQCEYKRRRGNWPPKTKKMVKKKCPLCTNPVHINFNKEKLWELKCRAQNYKQLADFHYARLVPVRNEHRRWEKKVDRAVAFRDKILRESKKRLREMQLTEEVITRLLAKV